MKPTALARMLLPFLSILATTGTAAAAAPAPPPPRRDFDVAFYDAVRSQPGNVLVSGASLREALGIAYLGARGDTAREMSTAIGLDPDRDASARAAKSELADLRSASGAAKLSIVNHVTSDLTLAPKADFVRRAADGYGAIASPLDFIHHPDEARGILNGWVAKETNDKIPTLFPERSITTDTRLVVTDAISFEGKWATAFAKGATRSQRFLVDGATARDVPMMHVDGGFAIGHADDASVLEMRYEKSDLAMDVILPDAPTGLASTEEKLVSGSLPTWTASVSPMSVRVAFPKVSFSWGGSAKAPLQKLGMKTAFDAGRADFAGIAEAASAGGNLAISDVFHKTFVRIDEAGTEAAAATGIVVSRSTAVLQSRTFTADHPFLFVIRDVKHGRILFLGRVTNPSA